MQQAIYSLGSSTRSWEEFLALLDAYGIRTLADVRAFPVSRRYPHFCRDHLDAKLPRVGVSYHWLGKRLGGYRTGGYEGYTASQAYRSGLAELEALAAARPTAFLCAERFPWKCHRRFIAASLQDRGWDVIHIIEADRTWRPNGPRQLRRGLTEAHGGGDV